MDREGLTHDTNHAEYVLRLARGEITQVSTRKHLEIIAQNQLDSIRGQAAQRALDKRAARRSEMK